MTFSIGDRVYYVSNRYGEDYSNPLKDGKYSCRGTVVDTYSNTILVVDWDNGCHNSYREIDLEYITVLKQMDPNRVWKKRKKS